MSVCIIIIIITFLLQVVWAEQQHEKIRVKRGHFHDRMTARGIVPRFNDPLWDGQWYLVSRWLNIFFCLETSCLTILDTLIVYSFLTGASLF